MPFHISWEQLPGITNKKKAKKKKKKKKKKKPRLSLLKLLSLITPQSENPVSAKQLSGWESLLDLTKDCSLFCITCGQGFDYHH